MNEPPLSRAENRWINAACVMAVAGVLGWVASVVGALVTWLAYGWPALWVPLLFAACAVLLMLAWVTSVNVDASRHARRVQEILAKWDGEQR